MKNEKDLLGGIIIIALLLLVLVTYMSFYNLKKDEEKILNIEDIEDNSLSFINIYDDYSTLKVEDKDSMEDVEGKDVIRTYNCKSDDCMVYTSDLFDNVYDDKFMVLKEKNGIFIYDFVLDKVVSNLYDEIADVLEDYYIVKTNFKYGIISKSGVEVVNVNYDEVNILERYNSFIKVKNNGLYGVVDLDNGNVVIDTKYKDIKINDSKYFSILKDGLWYVMDNEENILTNGYEYVFGFNKGFIALIDNSLQILKYNKDIDEKLNDNVINIYEKDGFEIKRNSSYISIDVNNGNEKINYQYNISRNDLKSK